MNNISLSMLIKASMGDDPMIEESDLLDGIDASKMLEEGRRTRGGPDQGQMIYRDELSGIEGIVTQQERKSLNLEFSKQPKPEDYINVIEDQITPEEIDEQSHWESHVIDQGGIYIC